MTAVNNYTFGMTGTSTAGAGDSSSLSDSLSSKSVERTSKSKLEFLKILPEYFHERWGVNRFI